MTKNPLDKIFARHGIDDPWMFLAANSSNDVASGSVAADVQARGSVFLMLGRVVTRKDVAERESKLRYA